MSLFITFEGPEGSGKSSQIALLASFLQQRGFSVVTTREPGGTPIGDEIRACVHNVANTAMTPTAEMLLYSASRAQLVGQVIRPSLAAGQMVLCDRFADSTIAYQGYGRGLNLEQLHQVTAHCHGRVAARHHLSAGHRRGAWPGAAHWRWPGDEPA
jgi:dTMP kinase